MAKVEARLGKTRYELEETATPGVVRVTRFNSDGEKQFFFPVALILEYAVEKMNAGLKERLRQMVGA